MLCLVLVLPSCSWSAFVDADCGRHDGRPKCEGRKSVAELRPKVIEAAGKLNDGRSLRAIDAGMQAILGEKFQPIIMCEWLC